MYCPAHFREDRPEVLSRLIDRHPLATVIHSGPDGLCADLVPLMHGQGGDGPGHLIGHVARNNPLWQTGPDRELLVVFQGPAAYISPNWYASKAEGGKVVPTWNYAVVQAHCTLTALHEPADLLQILNTLTDRQEATQPHPWRVSDAPAEFTDRLLGHIVGIRLDILRWQGKWKVSQNQPEANRHSVVQALRERPSVESPSPMAELVHSHTAR